MNKKQLRLYAAKFEGAGEIARIVFMLVAITGLWKLMNFFSGSTRVLMASVIYIGIVALAYWLIRREWRTLLAPLPKPVHRKTPAPAKDAP